MFINFIFENTFLFTIWAFCGHVGVSYVTQRHNSLATLKGLLSMQLIKIVIACRIVL